jgi:hypothetical protein
MLWVLVAGRHAANLQQVEGGCSRHFMNGPVQAVQGKRGGTAMVSKEASIQMLPSCLAKGADVVYVSNQEPQLKLASAAVSADVRALDSTHHAPASLRPKKTSSNYGLLRLYPRSDNSSSIQIEDSRPGTPQLAQQQHALQLYTQPPQAAMITA